LCRATATRRSSGFREYFAGFREYFATMPWLAVPFDEKRYEALSSHFEVEGIPTLVLLSPEGKVITTKGRAAVSAAPEGKDFPTGGPSR
jgi:nucleoredoxin